MKKLTLIILFILYIVNLSAGNNKKPYIADSLLNVSVYRAVNKDTVKRPISMKNYIVDFVKRYNVPTNSKNVSSLLQKAIDELSSNG